MNTALWDIRLAAMLAAASVLTTGCSTSEGSATDTDGATPTGARVTAVEVVEVGRSEFRDVLRVTGEVEAFEDVLVAAEEGGVIQRFVVDKGATVRRGDSLAVLDASVLRAQVDEARATARLAAEQHERQRILWEDEQIGTELAYLQAKYGAASAAARLATLEARLARMVIRAPVTGVFDERYVDQGEMALPGTPIVRVVALDRVKVVAGVPERYAAAIRRGNSARITFDVLPGRDVSGRITFVGNAVDADNRTFPIEIVLPNPGRVIKPRMVADVEVVRELLRDVVVVPRQVVLRTSTGYEVFVVVERDGETVAASRTVRLGPSHENRVVIQEGLTPGEQLIVVGQQLASDGALVKIVSSPEER